MTLKFIGSKTSLLSFPGSAKRACIEVVRDMGVCLS